MGRNLAIRVANARPLRAGSGVGNAQGVRPPAPGAHQWAPKGERKDTAYAKGLSAPSPRPAGASWDPQAERESGDSEQKYKDRTGGLEGDWKSRDEWYGLGETNNPYSQASLLSHRHEVDQRGILNSANNQLYAGSTVNRHASADRNFNVNLESLKAAYVAERERKERLKEEALNEWLAEKGDIGQGAADRAAETEPPPVAAAEGGGGGPSGSAPVGKAAGKWAFYATPGDLPKNKKKGKK